MPCYLYTGHVKTTSRFLFAHRASESNSQFFICTQAPRKQIRISYLHTDSPKAIILQALTCKGPLNKQLQVWVKKVDRLTDP